MRGLSCLPNIYVSWSTSELRLRLSRGETGLSPPVRYFTERSKAELLLWIFYVCSVLRLLCLLALLFLCVLWSSAGERAGLLALVSGVLL